MPHIIIEHSDDVQPRNAMAALHHYVTECGLFSPQAVKARSLLYQDYILPQGAASFVHITIAILDGRSVSERVVLADGAFAIAKEHFAQVDKLSLDIREMESETYRK